MAGKVAPAAGICGTGSWQTATVQNAEIVDRGYERIEEKLRALGADIERVPD